MLVVLVGALSGTFLPLALLKWTVSVATPVSDCSTTSARSPCLQGLKLGPFVIQAEGAGQLELGLLEAGVSLALRATELRPPAAFLLSVRARASLGAALPSRGLRCLHRLRHGQGDQSWGIGRDKDKEGS